MTHSTVSRRRFLVTTGTAAAACLAGGGLRSLQAADRFGGFPIGVQSYSLREFNLDDAVRHMQGMGIHYVELFSKHLPMDAKDDQLAAIKAKLSGAQIKISAHGVNPFSKDHDANRKWFEFAKRAGFPAPILHGLCSYGIACRSIVAAVCDYDAGAIRNFDARMTSPERSACCPSL